MKSCCFCSLRRPLPFLWPFTNDVRLLFKNADFWKKKSIGSFELVKQETRWWMHFTNFNYGFDKVGGLGLAAFTLVVTYYSRKKGKNWILMQTKAALCSIRKELDHFFTIIITILVVSIRESLFFSFLPFAITLSHDIWLSTTYKNSLFLWNLHTYSITLWETYWIFHIECKNRTLVDVKSFDTFSVFGGYLSRVEESEKRVSYGSCHWWIGR